MPSRPKRPSKASDFEELLSALRKRYERLGPSPSEHADFLAHVESLARWHEEPLDYVEGPRPLFPPLLPVAFAVCHPKCGAREFIVEGSTQECDHCGGSLFRMSSAEYRLVRKASRPRTRSGAGSR